MANHCSHQWDLRDTILFFDPRRPWNLMQIVKASTFSSLVSLELSAAPPLVPNSAGSKVLWMTEKVLAEVLSKAEDHP